METGDVKLPPAPLRAANLEEATSPKNPLDCWRSNFIARIKSRWDALLGFATCHWRLSWISPQSTMSLRCDTALKTWKKNAGPRTVLRRDCRIRFVAASD